MCGVGSAAATPPIMQEEQAAFCVSILTFNIPTHAQFLAIYHWFALVLSDIGVYCHSDTMTITTV